MRWDATVLFAAGALVWVSAARSESALIGRELAAFFNGRTFEYSQKNWNGRPVRYQARFLNPRELRVQAEGMRHPIELEWRVEGRTMCNRAAASKSWHCNEVVAIKGDTVVMRERDDPSDVTIMTRK